MEDKKGDPADPEDDLDVFGQFWNDYFARVHADSIADLIADLIAQLPPRPPVNLVVREFNQRMRRRPRIYHRYRWPRTCLRRSQKFPGATCMHFSPTARHILTTRSRSSNTAMIAKRS